MSIRPTLSKARSICLIFWLLALSSLFLTPKAAAQANLADMSKEDFGQWLSGTVWRTLFTFGEGQIWFASDRSVVVAKRNDGGEFEPFISFGYKIIEPGKVEWQWGANNNPNNRGTLVWNPDLKGGNFNSGTGEDCVLAFSERRLPPTNNVEELKSLEEWLWRTEFVAWGFDRPLLFSKTGRIYQVWNKTEEGGMPYRIIHSRLIEFGTDMDMNVIELSADRKTFMRANCWNASRGTTATKVAVVEQKSLDVARARSELNRLRTIADERIVPLVDAWVAWTTMADRILQGDRTRKQISDIKEQRQKIQQIEDRLRADPTLIEELMD